MVFAMVRPSVRSLIATIADLMVASLVAMCADLSFLLLGGLTTNSALSLVPHSAAIPLT